jgi:DNA-binding beta-propeller fold protein YncE
MNSKRELIVLTVVLVFSLATLNAQGPPLKLIQTTPMPGVKKGFDHLAADPTGNRLFVCAEWNNSVEVFDIQTGKSIHRIGGLDRPHSIHYREDLNRLYVVDGTEEMGAVRIFDGKSYALLKSVALSPDADWIAFDPATKYLYVTQGGDVLKHSYSLISVIDTTEGAKLGDIKVEGDVIEDLALETSSSKMYLGNKTRNEVNVIDRKTREVVASWPLKLGSAIAPVALDEKNHRLFIGCRSGQIVVFDTTTGKELQALPINGGVDDLTYDPDTKRLYANCGGPKQGGNGSLDVYQQVDADNYRSLGSLTTGPAARNGILVTGASRYFVAVPEHDNSEAALLVYAVQ